MDPWNFELRVMFTKTTNSGKIFSNLPILSMFTDSVLDEIDIEFDLENIVRELLFGKNTDDESVAQEATFAPQKLL